MAPGMPASTALPDDFRHALDGNGNNGQIHRRADLGQGRIGRQAHNFLMIRIDGENLPGKTVVLQVAD